MQVNKSMETTATGIGAVTAAIGQSLVTKLPDDRVYSFVCLGNHENAASRGNEM